MTPERIATEPPNGSVVIGPGGNAWQRLGSQWAVIGLDLNDSSTTWEHLHREGARAVYRPDRDLIAEARADVFLQAATRVEERWTRRFTSVGRSGPYDEGFLDGLESAARLIHDLKPGGDDDA